MEGFLRASRTSIFFFFDPIVKLFFLKALLHVFQFLVQGHVDIQPGSAGKQTSAPAACEPTPMSATADLFAFVPLFSYVRKSLYIS